MIKAGRLREAAVATVERLNPSVLTFPAMRSEDSSVAMIAGRYLQRSRVPIASQSLRGKGIASLSRGCTAKVRLAKGLYGEGAPGRLGARWP